VIVPGHPVEIDAVLEVARDHVVLGLGVRVPRNHADAHGADRSFDKDARLISQRLPVGIDDLRAADVGADIVGDDAV